MALTSGHRALVDESDLGLLLTLKWGPCRTGGKVYAKSTTRVGKDQVLMHRWLLGVDSAHVDHINGDTLDNRRANLRPASTAENMANQSLRQDNSSGVKGVWFDCTRGTYQAFVTKDGRRIASRHPTKEAAEKWVRCLREKLHGEFANHGGRK